MKSLEKRGSLMGLGYVRARVHESWGTWGLRLVRVRLCKCWVYECWGMWGLRCVRVGACKIWVYECWGV